MRLSLLILTAFLSLFLTSTKLQAQPALEIIPSSTYLQTCYNGSTCFSINNSAFLFYSENKNELYVKVDFKLFKTGVDSLDRWLNELDDAFLYFKVIVAKEQFPVLGNHGSRTIQSNGVLSFNHHQKPYRADLTIYELNEQGMLYRKAQSNDYDRLRVNLAIAMDPKDYKIGRKKHNTLTTVYINISAGYLNLLTPDRETLIADF